MSEATSSPAVDAAPANDTLAPIDVQQPAITQESFADASEAARYLASLRTKKPPAESATPATAEEDTAPEAAAAQETDPGEETEAAEAEELPPIEPPRSWTKEAKDRWNALPRETQEYLAQRESERDKGLQRSQNEIAEQRKAAEAERQKAEQTRKDYEAKLPALMEALQSVNAGQFGDVKTVDDVARLAQEDPFRFIQWQAHQQKMAAVQGELERANREQEMAKQTSWANHVQQENAKFHDTLSDADKGKLKDLLNAAPEFLEERGFSRQELTDLASGKEKISIYDHRLQSLILDGMKYRDLQKAPPKAVQKSLPPVQKPGTAQPRGAAKAASIQSLTQRLNETGSADDAFALWQARKSTRG